MDHTYTQFDTDLHSLRSATTTMAGLVERQLMRAIDAVRTEDLGRVAQVLTDEAEVNRMHVQTDLRCNQMIAKRQPIAVDLREIIAVLHMNNDLERIGDEAKKIAFKARDLVARPLPLDTGRIDRMAVIVCEMLRAAVDAFVRQDANVAASLQARDDEVDALRDDLIAELVALMAKEPLNVSRALAMVFIVQSIERVGDHAKNIAEYVVTVVDGTDPRHRKGKAAVAG
ncbi:MAG: phosphate signaling complex protein PhoU [Lautropia sp.]